MPFGSPTLTLPLEGCIDRSQGGGEGGGDVHNPFFATSRLRPSTRFLRAMDTSGGTSDGQCIWLRGRKKLAGGLVVLADVGFGFRAKPRARGFWGAFLAKQKAPFFLEGASVFSGGHPRF